MNKNNNIKKVKFYTDPIAIVYSENTGNSCIRGDYHSNKDLYTSISTSLARNI